MREASDLRWTLNLCPPGSPVGPHLELGSALQFRPRHHIRTLRSVTTPNGGVLTGECSLVWVCRYLYWWRNSRRQKRLRNGGTNGGTKHLRTPNRLWEGQKPQSRPKLDPHWPPTAEATFNPCSRPHLTFYPETVWKFDVCFLMSPQVQ